MAYRRGWLIALGLLLAALVMPGLIDMPHSTTRVAPQTASPAPHTAIASGYGQLPLAFELNAGQADPSVRFLTHGSGYSLFLTPSAAVMTLGGGTASTARDTTLRLLGMPTLPATPQPSMVVSIQWLGANQNPVVTGEQPLPGTVNYFIGNDSAKWRTNIHTYQQVRYHNIYPGIDLVYYGNQGQLEYDFVVAPGADPSRIALGFTGPDQVSEDLQGNLSLALPAGVLQQDKPLVYQTVNGARQTIAGGYALTGNHRVSFALGAYDPRLPLVIDPAYKFSTYLGGNGADVGTGIAVDRAGDAYVVGYTTSTNFPLVNPYQGTFAGGTLYGDVFVSKLNAAGTALIYSTYLGGSGEDLGRAIAIDGSSDAYLTGITFSSDFPTLNAVQPVYAPYGDAFVTELNAAGSGLVYSTYLGGANPGGGYGNYGFDIAVDSTGNAYVTGGTESSLFPVVNALQSKYGGTYDVFITKVAPGGSAFVFSTYLGGNGADFGYGIAVDQTGNIYVTGETGSTNFPTQNAFQSKFAGGSGDAFVTELNASGSAVINSTYFGGIAEDVGFRVVPDGSGDVYIAGRTASQNLSTVGAAQSIYGGGTSDAFVSKLDLTTATVIYSTYLGGINEDFALDLAVDSAGDAYITGYTYSTDFPTANPLQAVAGGNRDAFITRLDATGSQFLYSSYLGGTDDDYGLGIALGNGDTVYLTGYAASTNFPTANALYPHNAYGQDAYITKILTLPSVDTTTGVFRPSNGTLYLKNANTTGPADITLAYGLPGDQPITGDWTGKGYKSIGVYRNGTFYLRNSNTTGYADIIVPFGNSTDIPVAGDWTGKGYDSIGVYNPATTTFLLRNSNTAGPPDITARLGISGDVPITGDWTGKGWDSIGVFRPSNGIVYLRNSNTTGVADINFVYGIAGDKPVVGDWNADGVDTIGVDRGGRFLLRNSNTTGPADLSFYLGVSGDDPIAGPWLAPPSSPPPVHHGPRGSGTPTHMPGALAGLVAAVPRAQFSLR